MNKHEHDAFRKWRAFLNDSETDSTPTLNRFAARYQLSRKYQGIDARMSDKTMRGYSRIFHVFLAHSAFDSLIKGVDELATKSEKSMSVELIFDKNNHPMIDDELASEIRKIKGMSDVLIEYADNEVRIVRLKNFFGVNFTDEELENRKITNAIRTVKIPNNLLVVASAVRNVVAHGQLSATGANAMSKKNCETIERLAKFVEEKTLELFDSYVDALSKKYVSK
jgi:hypothetical protein